MFKLLNKNERDIIKYLFYVQLLLKIHTFESVFLSKYLQKLVICLFKENEDASDLLEIEDKAKLTEIIDHLINGVFQDLEFKK